jgi:hypothetical protein
MENRININGVTGMWDYVPQQSRAEDNIFLDHSYSQVGIWVQAQQCWSQLCHFEFWYMHTFLFCCIFYMFYIHTYEYIYLHCALILFKICLKNFWCCIRLGTWRRYFCYFSMIWWLLQLSFKVKYVSQYTVIHNTICKLIRKQVLAYYKPSSGLLL